MQGTSLPGVGLVLSVLGVGLLLSVSEGGVTFVRVRRGFTFVCVRKGVTFPRRKTRFPFSPVADRIRGQEGPVSTVSLASDPGQIQPLRGDRQGFGAR